MKHDSASHDSQDESYFASFTDMLVGIIFIFIILLMIVANDFQKATEAVTKINQEMQTAQAEARNRERDAARDIVRDAQRDMVRDKQRDEARDKALAQDKPNNEATAIDQSTQQAVVNASQPLTAEKNMLASKETKANDDTVRQQRMNLQNSFNDARTDILDKIQQSMNMQGFPVKADSKRGTLSIPEELVFERNQKDISYRGKQALTALADNLKKYLPCIAPRAENTSLIECSNLKITPNDGLDAIFIDDFPTVPGTKEEQLLLAVQHIVTVFNTLKQTEPYLDRQLRNSAGVPIMNIKVNQSRREVKNREINNPMFKGSVVFRFIMRNPSNQEIQKMQQSGAGK